MQLPRRGEIIALYLVSVVLVAKGILLMRPPPPLRNSLRMFPPSAHTERISVKDDVLPLRNPIVTAEGKVLTSLRIKKGQVRTPRLLWSFSNL